MSATTDKFLKLYRTLIGIKLTKNVPPPPPYGSKPTLAGVQPAVDGGAPFLPQIYREGYAAPLQSQLAAVVARQLRADDLVSLETLTGAVYQHNQKAGQAQLARFLAVISNLYRSFLDDDKRANLSVPLSETIPPLAMFQFDAANGPFTITCEQVAKEFGATIGVVSLPAAYRDDPFLWSALAHETGGHDVLHADPDLLPELGDTVQALFGTTAPLMGALWAYWIDEAASDVYGVLNIGPTFGCALASLFTPLLAQLEGKTSAPPMLRTQSGSDEFGRLDPHPTDILRLHLTIGVIESLFGLSASRKQQYTDQLLELATLLCPPGATSVELQGAIDPDTTIADSFPLIEMQDSARRVGAAIATVKLAALAGHSVQDIETWDDPDEEKALQVASDIETQRPLTGIGDDAQLLAGFNIAMMTDASLYASATNAINDALDESFANDPFWGKPVPDRALMRRARKFVVTPPKDDIDPIVRELIDHDARNDTVHGFVLANPDPIPWPSGLAPKPLKLDAVPDPNAALPKCDYVAVTWTVDEANSMARLLTPGVAATPKPGSDEPAWYHYAHNYSTDFRPNIHPGAPSWESHILGRYYFTKIGNKTVLCFKSELHLAQDGAKLPLKDLFQQIAAETGAKLVITTGTAGAVGANVKLGDVIVAKTCLFHCARTFKTAAFNGKAFSSNFAMPVAQFQKANQDLMKANASHLRPQRDGVPRIFWDPADLNQKDVIVTTDFFAFDNVQATYQLQGLGSAVEMDDAVLGLAFSELNHPPEWVAIRNASDPQMDGTTIQAEKAAAAEIYKKFGFWTTIPSVIATWAAIVGHS
jgi:nucleoside phosphorylase